MAARPKPVAHKRFARGPGLGAQPGVARLEFPGDTRDAVGRPNTDDQPAHGVSQHEPPQSLSETCQPGSQSFRSTRHFPGQCVWRFEQQRQCAEFQQSRRFQPRWQFWRWTLWWSPIILKIKIIFSTI